MGLAAANLALYVVWKGQLPYFNKVIWSVGFGAAGFFLGGLIAEKIAAEFHYNWVLLDLADKYNFTPEEVVDL